MATPKQRQPVPVVREVDPFVAAVDAINAGMAATTPAALAARADAQRAEDNARTERPHSTESGVIEIVYGSSKQWLVTLEVDGTYGFHWFASRHGVLWAKGWTRTRSQRTAELVAKRASAEAFDAAVNAGEVQP
ncbi:MAG: hypothetical protein AB7E70_19605 [Hyphomicrobiaceae bacterium]